MKIKKTLSLLLVMIMIFTSIPFLALAEQNEIPELPGIDITAITVDEAYITISHPTPNITVTYMVKKADEVAPTLEEIKSNGTGLLIDNGSKQIVLSKLESSTNYKIYFSVSNQDVWNNEFVTKDFTTRDIPPELPTISLISSTSDGAVIKINHPTKDILVKYLVKKASEDEPKLSDIQMNGTQILIENGSYELTLSNLQEETKYNVYFAVHNSKIWNDGYIKREFKTTIQLPTTSSISPTSDGAVITVKHPTQNILVKYLVKKTSEAAPKLSDIQLNGTEFLIENGSYDLELTNLESSTDYNVYFAVHNGMVWNNEYITRKFTTTSEKIPPLPTTSISPTEDSAVITVNHPTKDILVKYLVKKSDEKAPTFEELYNNGKKIVIENGTYSFNINNLKPATRYKIYMIVQTPRAVNNKIYENKFDTLKATKKPSVKLLNQPLNSYKKGKLISISVQSPEYLDNVQYRVVICNTKNNKTYELYTSKTGYYGNSVEGNKKTTINYSTKNLPQGSYYIKVMIKKVGSKNAYDNIVKSNIFTIK